MKKEKLKQELKNQDNLSTADPIFVVYDWEKIYGICSDYSDDYKWLLDGEEDDLEEMSEEEAEEKGYEKIYYKKVRKFISAFFTRKSAQEFIDKNAYHWNKPHIYVESLWRNYEMQEIRNYFLGGEVEI